MDNGDEKTADYEVGYGRPPKKHQFKKGQSGNPAGSKRRKPESDASIILRVSDELVSVNIGRKKVRISRFEAAIRSTLAKAIQTGDPRLLERMMRIRETSGVDLQQSRRAEAEEGGKRVMAQLWQLFDRTIPDDDHQVADQLECEERELRILRSYPDLLQRLEMQWAQDDDNPPKFERYPSRIRTAINEAPKDLQGSPARPSPQLPQLEWTGKDGKP